MTKLEQKHEYRSFGLIVGAVLAVVFGLALPWLKQQPFPVWPWPISGFLVALALGAPGLLRPIYKGWMKLGGFLGAVNSKVILSLAYFVVVVPSGFIMRLLGKDPMERNFDKKTVSYRVKRLAEKDPYVSQMDKPY